jgi:hypothetical protein
MENQESAQTVAPSIEAPKQPELTVTDLTNIRSIVDVAVRRGTFVASELSAVGATYDKLNAFLNAVTPPPEQAPKE